MNFLKKLILLPVVFVMCLVKFIAAAIGVSLVWLFDSSYDHDAAMTTTVGMFEFLKKWGN